jgi:hypothetical protein
LEGGRGVVVRNLKKLTFGKTNKYKGIWKQTGCSKLGLLSIFNTAVKEDRVRHVLCDGD